MMNTFQTNKCQRHQAGFGNPQIVYKRHTLIQSKRLENGKNTQRETIQEQSDYINFRNNKLKKQNSNRDKTVHFMKIRTIIRKM